MHTLPASCSLKEAGTACRTVRLPVTLVTSMAPSVLYISRLPVSSPASRSCAVNRGLAPGGEEVQSRAPLLSQHTPPELFISAEQA